MTASCAEGWLLGMASQIPVQGLRTRLRFLMAEVECEEDLC